MGWEHPGTLFCLAYRILRHLLDLLIVITRSDVVRAENLVRVMRTGSIRR
jgi:hypothetical protein